MISLQQVNLRRGQKVLLKQANLSVYPGQHFGITGNNGCGKSSLFELLLGALHQDQGDVTLPRNWRIAHMAQQVSETETSALDYVLSGDHHWHSLSQALKHAEHTPCEEDELVRLHAQFEAIDGYNAQHRAEQLLAGLGFETAVMNQAVHRFSGGWRIRLNLAKALMCPADLLLLDEPSNHLDLDAIVWLEQWLARFSGTLLLISHDRDFLDQTVDHILHIEHQQIHVYPGNFSAFERQRGERLAQQQAMFDKQQQQRAHLQRFVDRFKAKASKAKQAQSRVKALEKMQLIAAAHVDSPFNFSFPDAGRCTNPMLDVEQLDCGYGDNVILSQLNFSIRASDRWGLLGANGAGKSTLLKTIVGTLAPLSGTLRRADQLNIGYFHQHQLETLDAHASPSLHIQRISPQARDQEIRNFLGGFNFHGDVAVEAIGSFSGGEKARLALALIVWQKPNLLVLDEPTNHLDLEMRQALVEALQHYQGALIVVSHDRFLLRNTVDHFLLIDQGGAQEFQGDLEDYQLWLTQQKREVQADKPSTEHKMDRKTQRQSNAQNRAKLRPLQKKIVQCEVEIDQKNTRLDEIQTLLLDTSLYSEEQKKNLNAILREQGILKIDLTELEEQWLAAQEQLDALEKTLGE